MKLVPQPNKLVQTVNSQTGAVATSAVQIPLDDTIPQIGEGAQVLTATITPRSLANKLLIRVVLQVAQNSAGGSYIIGALFQDAGNNALAAGVTYIPGTSQNKNIIFEHYMTVNTIAATTFTVRVGPSLAVTVTLNGQAGARLLGTTYISSITITEMRA